MQIVPVALGARSYDIRIEAGALDALGDLARPFAKKGRRLVVSDSSVWPIYGARIRAAFEATGDTVLAHIVPAGEGSKSWAELARLCDWLLGHEVERGETIVALGGGVIGDLAGFAASIVKRGCGFIQVPTTLLSQVDSSVGGKTAINTQAGKNLIGSFHQPRAVFIDPDMLDTLPPRELRAGYAEVVKYGLIDAPEFFAWCEANGQALLAGMREARVEAIATSVRAKARIVIEDEHETTGKRALLNLGHTFGHALEAETGFGSALLHGEGVAAGMALAARYSVRRGLMEDGEATRIAAHLTASDLPISLRAAGVDAPGARLVAHMLYDKKASGGKLPFLLLRGIGATYLAKDVDLADVAAFLDDERAR